MTRVIALVIALFTVAPSLAAAQSLADVARAEEARRKSVQKPAKVYTNTNVKPDITTPAAPGAESADTAKPATSEVPPASGTTAAASSGDTAAATEMHDQAWWSDRMNTARTQLDRTRMFLDALQSRINALNTDFVNRDDPAQRSVIEQDRTKALAELDRVQKDLAAQTKAIADIQDEARRAGVPAGWLR